MTFNAQLPLVRHHVDPHDPALGDGEGGHRDRLSARGDDDPGGAVDQRDAAEMDELLAEAEGLTGDCLGPGEGGSREFR